MCGCVGSVDGVHDEAVPDVRRDGVPRVRPCDERHVAGDSERTDPRRELLTTGRGGLTARTGRTTVDLGGEVPTL